MDGDIGETIFDNQSPYVLPFAGELLFHVTTSILRTLERAPFEENKGFLDFYLEFPFLRPFFAVPLL